VTSAFTVDMMQIAIRAAKTPATPGPNSFCAASEPTAITPFICSSGRVDVNDVQPRNSAATTWCPPPGPRAECAGPAQLLGDVRGGVPPTIRNHDPSQADHNCTAAWWWPCVPRAGRSYLQLPVPAPKPTPGTRRSPPAWWLSAVLHAGHPHHAERLRAVKAAIRAVPSPGLRPG